jgi:hypothetical protein
MGSWRRFTEEMNAPHEETRIALDYEESASYIFKLVVKLATNPAWMRTRQRRVQTSTRQSGGSERCWAALPIVSAGARPVKPAGALMLATDLRGREWLVPLRFG